MSPLRSCVLICLLTMVITSPGMGQLEKDNLEALRGVAVKLRVHRLNQPDETAAGLYIGKDQQNAYFITAYHAVGPNSRGVPVQTVQLQFYSSPQNIDAFVLNNFEEALDLGVVHIAVANLPPNLPQIVGKNAGTNISIRIVGHPSAGDWSVWPGIVQNENTSSGDTHHFTTNRDESLAGGYSGGPVFDPEGNFVGMHCSTTSSYGIAVKSADILTQLAAWRVPTNNLATVNPILKVIELYAEAVASGDLEKVKAVRQLKGNEEKKMTESLKLTKGKGFVLRNCSAPEVTGDSARISCDTVLTQTAAAPARVTFFLKRIYEQWFILSSN